MSFSPWPAFTSAEADAVRNVLLSNRVNYWTGEEGRRFEREFARFTGSRHAVAVTNGTVALELALRGCGVGPGDEVVVTPRSFVASASAVVMVGATPVFADVDRDSQNLTAATVEAVLTPRTKAVICVHLAGWPCEMDELGRLVDRHDLMLIEDCAQAHGARYRGQSVGSLGDVAAWSFCQDKIITTGGEGGMVTLDQDELWARIWSLKDHGKSWEAVYQRRHPSGFRWLHESFGTNARITEMQAAIGRLQLARLQSWHQARARNAAVIMEAARECAGLRVPQVPSHVEHAWYRCHVFVEPEALREGWSRDRIMQSINEAGVPCFAGSCPEIYRELAFVQSGLMPPEPLPVAHELGETALAFLVHPTLTQAELAQTAEVLQDVLRRAAVAGWQPWHAGRQATGGTSQVREQRG